MDNPTEIPAVPSLFNLVRTLRDCCQRQEGKMCHQLGLTAAQFACLLAMPETPNELTIQQIAQAMGLSSSRASRVIDSMVRTGLLDRRPLAHDRRTQMVSLTTYGHEKWQEARIILAECEERLLLRFPPQRSQELVETLKELLNAW